MKLQIRFLTIVEQVCAIIATQEVLMLKMMPLANFNMGKMMDILIRFQTTSLMVPTKAMFFYLCCFRV